MNSGGFDRETSFLCKFYAKSFVVQNKYITFAPRSSSSLQGIAKTSFVSALASSVADLRSSSSLQGIAKASFVSALGLSSVDHAEALPFLRGLCMNEVPDVVVGTSMGGMYAQQMRGYNRICVNPAFEMSKKSKMLTVGTHEYFKPRKDGTTHFEITPEIIRHHAEMEKHQFDGITEEDRKQVWGMFADNDQQVNGESLFLQYYNQVIHFSGEHRMDDRVIEDVLVPLINRCVAK